MFKQLLQQLLKRVDGGEAALIVGLDGLVVEQVGADDAANTDQLAADCSLLIKSGAMVATSLPGGGLEEVVMTAGGRRIILRMLGDSYFFVLILADNAIPGLARFEMRRLHFDLEKELAL